MTDKQDEVRALVLRAYDAARQTSKGDWRTMSTAVLKNRIIQSSGEPFDQDRYGYRRMLDLVLDLPDLLLVDQSVNPPAVTLIDSSDSTVVGIGGDRRDVGGNVRVRPDLWRAVIDYRSGESYVLADGKAVPLSSASGQVEVSELLPTVEEADVHAWRRDFAAQVASLVSDRPEALDQLNHWARSGGPTMVLPGMLQHRWNQFQTTAVLARLRAWFEGRGLPEPGDLAIPIAVPRRPQGTARVDGEDALRSALVRCIQAMPAEELRHVLLPAASVLRALR